MRWLPKTIPVLNAIIALDLAMVFGFEAFRVLTSPIYGLERIAFADVVYGIGGVAGLSGDGLFNVAAFLGAVYLTITVIFALHLASRIGAWRGGRVSHEMLDAGLILVVIATLAVATPAVLKGAPEILIQERLPLWLVGLAATLSMIERLPETDLRRAGFFERLWLRFAARRRRARAWIVSPAIRHDAAPVRWHSLRDDAGMVTETVPAERPSGDWFALRLR
ncbi:MAG: hypothetical protein AB7V13_16320 [Pseudorhodoplanes sp.]|uniref:hypothetical protein n=1 Tax=Pseudorhodoplanes sp. TaxID=1934341 RepID=UPI003D0C88C1